MGWVNAHRFHWVSRPCEFVALGPKTGRWPVSQFDDADSFPSVLARGDLHSQSILGRLERRFRFGRMRGDDRVAVHLLHPASLDATLTGALGIAVCHKLVPLRH